MARFNRLVPPLVLGLQLLTMSRAVLARTEEQIIRASHEVLKEFLDLQIREIPDSLLAEAHGVAIIPDCVKLGFVVGGQHGRGVVVMRERDGSWRAPVFVTITGGSIGWQVGAQSTDFVLVFKTQKSVDGLLRGKFTLGADASVAAGPAGRRAGAATDTHLKAEIYSYSRNRGLFAGVSLDGSALQVDDVANATYYGAPAPGGAPPPVPESALKLVEIIAGLTNRGVVPVPAPTGVSGAAHVAVPAQPASLSFATGTTADPMAAHQAHLDAVQAELAQSATALSPLLDESWRRYLALPAEVYQKGARPSPATVEATLARFNAVARNRQYQALTSRPEFHNTHRLLQSLHEDFAATAHQLSLPPPPAQQAR
jgi:SH3 domain-containing YSC84-like protein 1